jgi:hypothetical protein
MEIESTNFLASFMGNQNQEISLDSVPEILSMEVDDSNEGKFQRKTVPFKSMDSQFFINPQQASSQFYSLYTNRLAAISPSLKDKARKKMERRRYNASSIASI